MTVLRVVLPILLLVLMVFSKKANAQHSNLYENLIDPLSIARLDGSDTLPVKVVTGAGWPKGQRDPIDQYFIIAQDNGAGVLSHLWFELRGYTDPEAFIKIWVDDTLVTHSKLYDFFQTANGVFRAPLDTVCSGSLVCDVQIPYKKNFRVTYYADWAYCCLVWGIEYRPFAAPSTVESFRLPPSSEYQSQLTQAEKQYHKRASPWDTSGVKTIDIIRNVESGESVVLSNIIGPAVIESFKLIPSHIDSSLLRRVFIVMHWDDSPYPSVEVPLMDFFGCGSGLRDFSSFYQHATKGGEFTSYFPMPFAHRGKLSIVNRSTSSLTVLGSLTYSEQPIDRTTTGYFSTHFNASMPTIFGVYHHAGRMLGRGRYVGIHMAFPGFVSPYFLEGDPIFTIDSSEENLIRYTGIEEYCSGGWFFDDGAYSLPFAGCPEKWYSTYRFHVLSPYDFHNSFDLKIEHGLKNDYQANLRTVSFFYKEWTPFWISHDTICEGNTFVVGGSGYTPHQEIIVLLGAEPLFSIFADAYGSFSQSFVMPSIAEGSYQISVNNIRRPEPIFIAKNPVLTIIRDSIPYIYRYGERIHLRGNGFPFGKKVSLSIDTSMVAPSIVVDSNHQFDVFVSVPWIPAGEYTVSANIENTVDNVNSSTFTVSRALVFEGEDLYPPIYTEANAWKYYLSYHFDSTFSRRNGGFFGPQSAGKIIRFEFFVPVNDTFRIECVYAKGRQYGIYDIYLDSLFLTRIDGYKPTDHDFDISPARSNNNQIKFFTKGRHVIEFRNADKQSSATDRQLVFDNMLLTPVTAFNPKAPGDKLTRVTDYAVIDDESVLVFPNPLRNAMLTVHLSSITDISRVISSVKVMDIRGVTLYTYLNNSSLLQNEEIELDLTLLSNGVFFCTVMVQDQGRNTSYITRFVIDR